MARDMSANKTPAKKQAGWMRSSWRAATAERIFSVVDSVALHDAVKRTLVVHAKAAGPGGETAM